MSLNSAAYVAEIIRSGILSIDKGQMEASRSLGLNYYQSLRYIIIPQAIKNILPALCGEFVAIIKETSIVSVIGVTDIMFQTNVVRSTSYKPVAPLIIASIMYFIITFSLTKLISFWEGSMKKSD